MNTSTYSPNSASVSTGTTSFSAGAAKTQAATPPKEDKTDAVKDKLSDTAQQVGSRIKGLFHIPEPIRQHPVASILGGTGALLVLGGAVTVGILESQRRQTFSYRFMKGLHKATQALSL